MPLYKRHPLSAAFGDMPQHEFAKLCDDIYHNGLYDDIITHNGMILDGWHRYLACDDVGVEPRFSAYTDYEPDIRKWVLSKNLLRRHIPKREMAKIALAVRQWVPEPTAEPGELFDDGGTTCPGPRQLDKEIAEEIGSSPRTVRRARQEMLDEEDPSRVEERERKRQEQPAPDPEPEVKEEYVPPLLAAQQSTEQQLSELRAKYQVMEQRLNELLAADGNEENASLVAELDATIISNEALTERLESTERELKWHKRRLEACSCQQ